MGIKIINLTKGKEMIVDGDWHDMLSLVKWHVDSYGYARRTTYFDRKYGKDYVHRMIMGAKDGQIVDHINGDILDNRRGNLRLCSPKENSQNRKKNKTVTHRYKGIRKKGGGAAWEALIKVDGKMKYLGRYKTQEEAGSAYNKAAVKYFGEFAYQNNIALGVR